MGHGAPSPLAWLGALALGWGWLVLAPAVVVGVEAARLATRVVAGARAWRAGIREVLS